MNNKTIVQIGFILGMVAIQLMHSKQIKSSENDMEKKNVNYSTNLSRILFVITITTMYLSIQ